MPSFEIVGNIKNREVIAQGRGIRDLSELKSRYGDGNWRKCKGEATIELPDGRIRRAELHWYEAHGIGKRRIKRKRYYGLMRALETTSRAANIVICVRNEGYELDFKPWHVYEVIPDETLEISDLRVIDETGEDYIYPASYFVSASEIERSRSVL